MQARSVIPFAAKLRSTRTDCSRGTGARGLRAILETIMTDLMFELPDREDVREVVITRESVTEGRPPLVVTERARTKREA